MSETVDQIVGKQIEGQLKMDYLSIDPRALPTDVLRRLRIIPIGKRVLVSTGDGDYRPIGFTTKKEDEQPDIEGVALLNGGYYIEEIGRPTKGKIGRYSALVKINLHGGETDHIDPTTIFLAEKPSIIKPSGLISEILAERSK